MTSPIIFGILISVKQILQRKWGDNMSKLKAVRQQQRLTQVDVAKRLNVGQGTVSLWEAGITFPRADNLMKLAKLYGCTVDEILQTEDKQ